LAYASHKAADALQRLRQLLDPRDAVQLRERDSLRIADRVEGWDAHAPDPDQPLLTETLQQRVATAAKKGREPTSWWVYATIGAAVATGLIVLYAHSQDTNTREIKLHYP